MLAFTVIKVLFKLKYIVRTCIPNLLWLRIASRISNLRAKQYSEKVKHYGDQNQDLTFLIIRKRPPAAGFFANTYHVLQGIMYALEKNYIPVVDMKNYWVDELSSVRKINGTHNAWEYLFKPVSEYSLKEVYKSKNVILSNGESILAKNNSLHGRNFTGQISNIKLLNSHFKEYIQVNDQTQNYINRVKKELNWNPDKTLAIFIRGTAYNQFPNLKDLTADLDFFMTTCNEMLIKYSLTKIYISTEDFILYNKLVANFSKIEIIPSLRFPPNLTLSNWKSSQKVNHDGSIRLGYEKTLLYLAEARLLCECNNFVGTISNASVYILGNSNLDIGEKVLVKQQSLIRIA